MSFYMNDEAFEREIRQRVQERLLTSGGGTLETVSVTKNNGVRMDGLTLKHKGEEVAQVVYFKDCYAFYKMGMDLDEIVQRIVDRLMETCPYFPLQDLKNLTNYEEMRKLVTMKLVSYERNREALKDRPHLRKLDLAIEFRISCDIDNACTASTAVTTALMEAWGVSESVLFEQACTNMRQRWHPVLLPMSQLFVDLLDFESMEPKMKMNLIRHLMPDLEKAQNLAPFYLLSNQLREDGAILWFSTDKIKDFARERKCRVFILPSSVHELLLLPDDGWVDTDEIRSIIRSVNRDVVDARDFLSDHLYVYDPASDTYAIVP